MAARKSEPISSVARFADGTQQVLNEKTATAKSIMRKLCNMCKHPIGRSRYHVINDEYYHHPDCTKAF